MAETTRSTPPLRIDSADVIARRIVADTNGDIRLALPLGLGKPVTLLNALTRLAVDDPEISLSIFTALTLEPPAPSSDLERRFLGPAMDRLFGKYPALDYATMLRAGTLPDNITVSEFFFLAGRWLGVAEAQQSYIAANYTHALDVLAAQRPNVLIQLLAHEGTRLSLSSNTDITVDLLRLRKRGEARFMMAGEVNDELPFMTGDAELAPGEVDWLLQPKRTFELFSAVKRPVSDTDQAIGLHVSRLIPDGGTLQIGIGAIGDAVAQALILRHRGEIAPVWSACPFAHDDFGETGRFETGLYAVTEMLVDGILELFNAGVIKREVDGAAIHAGFFVECRDFYRKLREMPPERRARIAMKPVSFTNSLLGGEAAKRAARAHARFVNSAMKATLMGAVVSDGVENGQVVSGVGGQFNFVNQAFELKGARSVITLPATRRGGNGLESNIVWSYGHVTIPRHLRDIVVTEYGVADLRGRTDAEVIAAMLTIADSRFQDVLLKRAKKAGKIADDHAIPERHRNNLPGRVTGWLGGFRDGALPEFPFGTDFDQIERRLLKALSLLKEREASKAALAGLVWAGLTGRKAAQEAACMERMGFARTRGLKERASAAALRGALRSSEPADRA